MNTRNSKKSNWYLPPDWRFLLGLYFLWIPLTIITTIFSTGLGKTLQGDVTLIWASLAIGFVGIVLLFIARLPLYRQHNYLSIGPAGLPEKHQKIYWSAYRFIGTSIAMLTMILLALS